MIRHALFLRSLVFVALLIGSAGLAHGQDNFFSVSGGYSHIYGTRDSLFHNKDGPYFDADFAWQVQVRPLPLQVGFGLSGSGYFDRQHFDFPLDNDFFARDHLFSDVGFFEFEPRVAFTLWAKDLRGLFFRPRIGFGLLVNSYSIDDAFTNNGTTFFGTHNHDGVAFEVHPALQVGYAWRYSPWGIASIGGEASYMPSWGDFGRLGSNVQELRAGAFLSVRF